ncbi:9645_t:CDS:2 [Diversispora eburnea]|uniref:9645_t:CDS:1 n=1 Tax=Diversispora eburnea TaxID=1213867 RepID=A0A9N8ZLQ5_9GLOM|nr:9645_t:CDS:2 [Diversispora eburnea]
MVIKCVLVRIILSILEINQFYRQFSDIQSRVINITRSVGEGFVVGAMNKILVVAVGEVMIL